MYDLSRDKDAGEKVSTQEQDQEDNWEDRGVAGKADAMTTQKNKLWRLTKK